MRRRSRAGGEPVKTRRRKTAARQRAPKSMQPRSSSVSPKKTKVARLTKDMRSRKPIDAGKRILQSEFKENYAELIRDKRRIEILCEALRAKVQLLETVLENGAESIYAKDKEGRYTYINRVCEIEFKLIRELALGRTDFEIFPRANAEEYRSNDLFAMETGQMREHEVWWDHKIYLTRKLPLTSLNGEILGVCGISINITDHRRTELALQDAIQKLERERENKLMNIEAIMASIAHEIRQPLAGAATNGSAARRFLAKAPADIDEVRACLDRIIRDCGRASEVFDSIRALFRRGDEKWHPVDVNEIALEMLQALRGELLERNVTTHTELASDLPLVQAHSGQLRQVISNLVQNAIEAMGETGDRNRVLRVKTEVQNQDAIIVAVEDTGPGIDPKRIDSVFDAFVTTKSHGIGLGLAICRKIVERHGGQLDALSDGKNGARFQFSLPFGTVVPPNAENAL
jgi:C4-dicarboxylate-specific signal transduction histidine kinase